MAFRFGFLCVLCVSAVNLLLGATVPVNVEQFISYLQTRRDAALAAARKGVDVFGEQVIGDAQQLCPIDTGFLAGSGTTEPAKIEGTAISKTIGFNAVYAVFVHENLTAKHDVGQAKFLETAMRTDAPKMKDFVIATVKAAMES